MVTELEREMMFFAEEYAQEHLEELLQKSPLLSPDSAKEKLIQEFKAAFELDELAHHFDRALQILSHDYKTLMSEKDFRYVNDSVFGAIERLQENQWTPDEGDFQTYLGIDNQVLGLIEEMALTKFHERSFADCISLYVFLNTLSPSNPLRWMRMGIVFQEMGDHQKAIEAFETSLEINPENFKAEIFTACSLIHLESKEKAILRLQKARGIYEQLLTSKEPVEQEWIDSLIELEKKL